MPTGIMDVIQDFYFFVYFRRRSLKNFPIKFDIFGNSSKRGKILRISPEVRHFFTVNSNDFHRVSEIFIKTPPCVSVPLVHFRKKKFKMSRSQEFKQEII